METLPPRILLIFVHSCTPLTNEEEKRERDKCPTTASQHGGAEESLSMCRPYPEPPAAQCGMGPHQISAVFRWRGKTRDGRAGDRRPTNRSLPAAQSGHEHLFRRLLSFTSSCSMVPPRFRHTSSSWDVEAHFASFTPSA